MYGISSEGISLETMSITSREQSGLHKTDDNVSVSSQSINKMPKDDGNQKSILSGIKSAHFDRKTVRDAIVLSEILGPAVSKRHGRRQWL